MANKKHEPDDYLQGAYFVVELDGLMETVFQEAEGLTVTREVVEYHEGGENGKMHKLLGPTRWQNIVLRTGVTWSDDFFKWAKKTIDGQEIERKNGAIVLCDREGKPKIRWDFTNGWPCRWEGPRLSSHDHDLKIELLEIAHDGFEMKKS
jgi:phage tail-like protein